MKVNRFLNRFYNILLVSMVPLCSYNLLSLENNYNNQVHILSNGGDKQVVNGYTNYSTIGDVFIGEILGNEDKLLSGYMNAQRPNIPGVQTNNMISRDVTTATGGGNVTDAGGEYLIKKGLIWRKNSTPNMEINDGSSDEGITAGEFESDLTQLSPESNYKVVAYADNGEYIGYGEEVDFWTLAVEPTIQSKNITFHSITKNRIGLRWTNGNGKSNMVLASMSNMTGTDYLNDGEGYSVGTYGAQTLPSPNNHISLVYSGTSTTTLVENLQRNTLYYFRVLNYNGSNQTANYLQTTASNNPLSKMTSKKDVDEEIIVENTMNLFPNPVQNELNINANLNIENASLVIYDANGGLVFESENYKNVKSVNTTSLLNGVYHIIISNGEEVFYNSFVVEK